MNTNNTTTALVQFGCRFHIMAIKVEKIVENGYRKIKILDILIKDEVKHSPFFFCKKSIAINTQSGVFKFMRIKIGDIIHIEEFEKNVKELIQAYQVIDIEFDDSKRWLQTNRIFDEYPNSKGINFQTTFDYEIELKYYE